MARLCATVARGKHEQPLAEHSPAVQKGRGNIPKPISAISWCDLARLQWNNCGQMALTARVSTTHGVRRHSYHNKQSGQKALPSASSCTLTYSLLVLPQLPSPAHDTFHCPLPFCMFLEEATLAWSTDSRSATSTYGLSRSKAPTNSSITAQLMLLVKRKKEGTCSLPSFKWCP